MTLQNFNVLVGANAAGKTNFVDSFRFLSDILDKGVTSAVAKRFGWENVLKRDIDKKNRIRIEIHYDLRDRIKNINISKKLYKPLDIKYELEISYSKGKFFIDSESFAASFNQNGIEYYENFDRTRYQVKIIDSITFGGKGGSYKIPAPMRDKPFLQGSFICVGANILANFINLWRFYELDAHSARQPCFYEGQDTLIGDGHNLASILDKVKSSPNRKTYNRILDVMSILVPNFNGWRTIKQFDGSLGFRIKEKGMSKGLLPKMVSDGTIRLLAILIALLYQPTRTELICIDEPERYLHPQALKPLVEIMRDVSKTTQIVVTTHSADLVKWLKPSELMLVDKKDIITNIVRAKDVKMVEDFLQEFSLDELWLKGLLQGGTVI